MNILFLIGNGFDLNVGLNTRYKDALTFYLNEKSDDTRIKRFKEDINIDFETHEEEIIQTFNASLTSFYTDLNSHSQNLFKQIMTRGAQQQVIYDFITFNYTNVLEKCLDFVKKQSIQQGQKTPSQIIRQVLHIHGDISKNPLIGVDNAEQIKNKELADTNKINNLIIKPTINKKLKNHNDTTAIQLIDNADIICFFGLSLGDTDETWWKHIGNKLKQGSAQLVIFNVVEEWNPIHADEEIENIENVMNRFYDVASIEDKIKPKLETQIHIGLNTNLFKINLVNDTSFKSKNK
jgi:hypothetical protein